MKENFLTEQFSHKERCGVGWGGGVGGEGLPNYGVDDYIGKKPKQQQNGMT